jgi:penicillin amidase
LDFSAKINADVDMPFVSPVRACLTWLGRQRLPQTQGRIVVEGLASPVEILRDRWGIPHIYGQTLEDGLFGQGFSHAQDRLWQMDFIRRLMAGRLSEIFGRPTIPLDRWLRILGLYRAAVEEALHLSETERRLSDAYCAGVNAAIDRARAGRLPVEFTLLGYKPEPWQPVDSLAWRKLMSWMLSTNWECELVRLRLIEHLGAGLVAELDQGEAEAWPVILAAGNRLAGKPENRPPESPTGSPSGGADWWTTLLGPGP